MIKIVVKINESNNSNNVLFERISKNNSLLFDFQEIK
jgi:hypothetical protein